MKKIKVLLVSDNLEVLESMTRALPIFIPDNQVGVITSNHIQGIAKFVEEQPDKTIVFDYNERGNGKGKLTFVDIKNSASKDQVVLRIGVDKYNYGDYIAIPFLLEEVARRLL